MVRVLNRPVKDVLEGLRVVLSKSGGVATEVPGAGTVAAASANSTPTAGAAGTATTTSAVGGMLVLSDVTPRIDQALDLLKRLDTAVDSGVIEEVRLKHLSAAQAATLVKDMAAKRESVVGRKPVGEVVPALGGDALLVIAPEGRLAYWRDLIAQLDQREGVETVNYTPHSFAIKDVAKLIEETIKEQPAATLGTGSSVSAGDDRFRIVVDDLTGTLVITATQTQHARIGELMTRLENVPAAARRPMRSYTLKNRPVKEVVAVLSQMLSAGILESSDVPPPQDGAKPAPLTGVGAVMPGEAYRPDVTPSLPARSTPAPEERNRPNFDPKRKTGENGAAAAPGLSFASDEATNTLIAVGEHRLLSQLESLLVTLDVRQPQVLLEVLLVTLSDSDTLKLGAQLDRLTKSGDAQIRLSSLFGLGVNAGTPTIPTGGNGGTVTVLSPGEFSIVVNALQTLSQGRTLSVPRMLVGNNQKADFNTTRQIPVSTTTRSNQDTIQGFAGYEQAGTLVSVQPQITEADHLLLQYNVTLSSFDGGGSPPARNENKLSSQVSVPDGYTIALGGIDLDITTRDVSQVPLLGSIPLIGEAFKNRDNTDSHSRFFVFIHAEIMRNPSFEDLKFASDVTTGESGVSDGFPVVKPQVMR